MGAHSRMSSKGSSTLHPAEGHKSKPCCTCTRTHAHTCTQLPSLVFIKPITNERTHTHTHTHMNTKLSGGSVLDPAAGLKQRMGGFTVDRISSLIHCISTRLQSAAGGPAASSLCAHVSIQLSHTSQPHSFIS